MFDTNLNLFQNGDLPANGSSEYVHARQYNTALHQFKAALVRGKLSCLKNRVFHRQEGLFNLSVLKAGLVLRGSSYAGVRVVSIRSIIGSENRIADFDSHFHPLNERSRDRWVSMAIAYLSRLPLPPIQLIQVGDAYFVRDGHHRISVSQAFGQVAMDAEVITWKARPPFPWQCCPLEQPANRLNSLDLSS